MVAILPSRGHLATLETFLVVTTSEVGWGQGYCYPSIKHRTAPCSKKLSGPKGPTKPKVPRSRNSAVDINLVLLNNTTIWTSEYNF